MISTRPRETRNIACHLVEMARNYPSVPAVINPEGRSRTGLRCYSLLTYRRLDRLSDEIAVGLKERGILPGMKAAVLARPSPELFALTFALFRAGIAPVLVDPGIGIRQIGRCLEEAEPELFLGVPQAAIIRAVLGWGKRTIRQVIWMNQGSVIRLPRSQSRATLDDIIRLGRAALERNPARASQVHCSGPNETAAILFTSGSTGPSKGVVYTHGMLEGQVERLRDLYCIEPGEIDLCTFPLFALFAPALGMTSIIPTMDPTRPAKVNPTRIFEVFEDFGVTNLFGSPALLRRLATASGTRRGMLGSLKRVVSAGAPATTETLEAFTKLLGPSAQIFTPYGATESLPVSSIGSREILGETRKATEQGAGVCVGFPVPGVNVRIIRITDEPIPTWSDELEVPDGDLGEFVVSGPVVSPRYHNRAEATDLAKIQDPANSRFYHRMGDVGYRDDQGRLWFCGRKSHRVVLKEETLHTIPCERVFNVHPEVSRTALVGVEQVDGTIPVLCVELSTQSDAATQARIREELLEIGARFPHTRRITEILFHDSFPVDIRHNAKIFREKLAVWAAGRLP